jgi:catechol 2,3-dioxygenase-like lactoylglutathione lyase family enzyme
MDLLVNIDVDDLSKAIAFYQEAAGLRLGRRFGSLGVEMLGASSAIYLLVKPDGTRPSINTKERIASPRNVPNVSSVASPSMLPLPHWPPAGPQLLSIS